MAGAGQCPARFLSATSNVSGEALPLPYSMFL